MKITNAIREIKTVDEALNYIRALTDVYERRMAYQYLKEANVYLKSNNILTFATPNEARNWISENEPKEDHLYRCSYNEYARPFYYIIAR